METTNAKCSNYTIPGQPEKQKNLMVVKIVRTKAKGLSY